MRIIFFCLLAVIVLSSCSKPTVSVTVKSAKVVENLSTQLNVFLKSDLGTSNAMVGSNSMLYTFPEREIIRVELDCTFIGLGESLKTGSDEHKQLIFDRVLESAVFTVNEKKVDYIWGYWPKSSGKNDATNITLFYLIPDGTSMADLKLTFDGAALGDPAYTLTFTDFKEE